MGKKYYAPKSIDAVVTLGKDPVSSDCSAKIGVN